MALNFPSSPADGQLHIENSITYRYSSSVGAWLIVPAEIPNAFQGLFDKQIIFNNQGSSNGSNGLTFSTTANTFYTHNVAVTANVSATYFLGNGSLLTGVVSDFSPAYNQANDSYALAQTAFDRANTSNDVLFIVGAYDTANAAFNKANAANLLAYGTGIGANAYSDSVGTSGNNFAGVMANAANAYAASLTPDLSSVYIYANNVGSADNANLSIASISANNWANTKLSNTDGVVFNGTLNIKTDLNIGNNITSVNSVIFNTAAGITAAAEGQMTWNADESTFDFGMANGSILQVGQEIYYRVKNQTGSTIPEGTVVMAAGTLGASGRIKVAPAISDGTYPSKYLMGIATNSIPNGADGYVTHFGKVRGIDTSMWSEGDILYANVSVAGALQNTMPTAPNTKTTVAIVVSKHATTGTLFVRPTYGSKLNEDELVELTSLSDGDLIRYVTANGRFENINENSTGPAINAAAAFDKANSANVFVKAAFDKANTGGGNTFAVISVPGKSNVEATITGDTVTLVSNGGINIETNQTNKTVYLTLADTIDYGLVDGSVTATNDYGSV